MSRNVRNLRPFSTVYERYMLIHWIKKIGQRLKVEPESKSNGVKNTALAGKMGESRAVSKVTDRVVERMLNMNGLS